MCANPMPKKKKQNPKDLMPTNADIGAKESDYLYVDTSQIKNAGKGLHTAIDIYKDEVISLFKGEILTDRQVQIRLNKGQDKYFIGMLDGSIMDSAKVACFAKYANDGKAFGIETHKNNAKITIDEYDNVCLIATRKIKSGEEIFCAYGKQYWNNYRP